MTRKKMVFLRGPCFFSRDLRVTLNTGRLFVQHSVTIADDDALDANYYLLGPRHHRY